MLTTCPACEATVSLAAAACPRCGHPLQPPQPTPPPLVYVQPQYVLPLKSVGLSLVLTFLFGPLGMLYSTIGGAIVMFFVSIIAAVPTLGLGLLITGPICMIWGACAASSYNDRLMRR